jgi:hypothetical protein
MFDIFPTVSQVLLGNFSRIKKLTYDNYLSPFRKALKFFRFLILTPPLIFFVLFNTLYQTQPTFLGEGHKVPKFTKLPTSTGGGGGVSGGWEFYHVGVLKAFLSCPMLP